MKKILRLLTLALAGAMFMVACDETPAPYDPNPGGGDEPGTETTEITCAKAVELCAALADGASSTETYAITGYITDVYATVSNGQQSFWMSDNNDGQKVVQAYWANLPEGVEKFTAGSKVKITGKLLKYVKDGNVTTEIKNATVEILEQGGDQPGIEATEITCAKAVELCAALDDGASSAETYAITGYITDVYATVSKGQQSFWMSDNNDGQKVVQAYWANLPEGVEAFTKGSKVKITGKLLKYVKDGNVTTEIKNATVEILEQGGGGETPDTPEETTEFSIDLPCTMGANAYNDGKATINGVKDVLTVKIGTAKKPGSFTVTMPAGKHTFYAVTWKGAGTADVTFSNGETLVKTVTVKENEGATGNAPFTLTVTDADKYEIEVAEETTFTVTSDKRVIFFGIK